MLNCWPKNLISYLSSISVQNSPARPFGKVVLRIFAMVVSTMVAPFLDTSSSMPMMSRLTRAREKVCQGCGGGKEEHQWNLDGDSLTFLTADNVNVILKNHSRNCGGEII